MRSTFVALALVAVFMSGCGSGHEELLHSQVAPSPVVLADTSAAQLAVTVSLTMGGYDSSTREKTTIDVLMQHDGRPVQFIKSERVDCVGVRLAAFTGSFDTTVSTASIAGKSVTCTYTSGRQSTQFTFRAPHPLVVVSPREHDRVAHGPNTVIRYEGGADNTPWVVAISPSWKSFANRDAITPTGATLDTSRLLTGDGSITLTDPNNVPLADLEGSRFKSIAGSSRRVTSIAVSWI
jgi:hypothetical protein